MATVHFFEPGRLHCKRQEVPYETGLHASGAMVNNSDIPGFSSVGDISKRHTVMVTSALLRVNCVFSIETPESTVVNSEIIVQNV